LLNRNDWGAFANLLAEDLVAIDEDGIHSKKEVLDEIRAAEVRFSDYKMENVKVIPQTNGGDCGLSGNVGWHRAWQTVYVAHLHTFPLGTPWRQMADDHVSRLDSQRVKSVIEKFRESMEARA
jgi:Domain of unknown function (DUF4440)